MRPRQWVKNLLVVAAPGAAGVLGRDDVPARVGVAFVAFCLLSAGTYLVNDVRDLHERSSTLLPSRSGSCCVRSRVASRRRSACRDGSCS
jgi:hypothetical protein